MGNSRQADKFVLRMPDGLRARIAIQAREHSRSMNTEIIRRLDRATHTAEVVEVQNQLITQLSNHIEQLRRDLELANLRGDVAVEDAKKAEAKLAGTQWTYASDQATNCAGCGKHKHTPLRVDWMGGYVCLTCIYKKLSEKVDPVLMALERDYPDSERRLSVEMFAEWLMDNQQLFIRPASDEATA